MNLNIGYLYADLMNIYGDTGNIIALEKRAQWRGIEVKVHNITIGDQIPTRRVGTQIDLLFFGGGQDQSQQVVSRDLVSSGKGKVIKEEVDRGVPLLSICGGYQLLGEYYQPHQGPKLLGIGLFPTYTTAGDKRMIGNIVVESSAFNLQLSDSSKKSDGRRLNTDNYLVGFENHSGKTYLKDKQFALGKVIKGCGNNGEDQTEGCIHKNAIGCYMHGSLLPKNPILADWLLQKALSVKYDKEIELKSLDDSLEKKAHNFAVRKFG